MRTTSIVSAGLSCLSLVSAAPFSFPLPNGFPNIANPSPELTAIYKQAHGTLPNGPLPATLAAADIASFKLIAFNEIFEVAYFSTLLANITSGAPGYSIPDDGTDEVVAALTAIIAQEELHALLANTLLGHVGAEMIQPCKYMFPVDNFQDAIAFASTFTDVVLGTLQAAATGLGANGDYELIQGVAAVIGQEGEQNGAFRVLQGKIPSALPFLTVSTPEFAFSALNQLVVVPGSCPNIATIPIPIFEPLMVVTSPIAAATQTLTFAIKAAHSDCETYSIAYINQQNVPVVEPITNVKEAADGMITFEALLPYDEYTMNGLTIAAVVKGSGPFASAAAVAADTVFGPGIIEIN